MDIVKKAALVAEPKIEEPREEVKAAAVKEDVDTDSGAAGTAAKKKHFDRKAYKAAKMKESKAATTDAVTEKAKATDAETTETETVEDIQAKFLKIHPKKVHNIDPAKLKAALRGEDIYTNYFDPAVTKKHSTVFYLSIYCIVFGCIVFVIYTACIGKNSNSSKNTIKRYIRQLRGKHKGSER